MALLDGPPPAPPPQSQPQGFGGMAPQQAPMGGLPQDAVQGVLQMGQEIDTAILGLAQAIPAGATEFSQARQLIQAGLAKFLQAGAAAMSPTNVGNQWPGGGFSAGLP